MTNKYYRAQELMKSVLPKIVTVGVMSGDELLTGLRRDNGLWTSPGGHLDDGEDLLAGAKREVKEESGIDVDINDLHLIRAEEQVSHRTGKRFIVFAFVAHVNKQFATAKADPDQEIAEWRWVKARAETPELARAARHAKSDFVLEHLGIHQPQEVARMGLPTQQRDEQDKGRTMQQVSKDLESAHDQPEQPSVPEPKAKTPEELKQDPNELLDEPPHDPQLHD